MKHLPGAVRLARAYCWHARPYMPSSLVGAPSLSLSLITERRTLLIRCDTELLVDVVDVVLNGSGIDEKFLGVTLFALVPNTTEFMNAVSFAMNGNIALR